MAKDFSILEQFGRIQEDLISKPMSKVETVLHRWTTERINKATSILEENQRNTTARTLSQSITIDERTFGIDKNGNYRVDVLANYYWKFIEFGVDGSDSEFKTGRAYSFENKQPPKEAMLQYIKDKAIGTLNWIDDSGQLITKELNTPEEREAAAFVFARAVKRKGIKQTAFIEPAFSEEEIDKLVKELADLF
jgi:hypothetical protein